MLARPSLAYAKGSNTEIVSSDSSLLKCVSSHLIIKSTITIILTKPVILLLKSVASPACLHLRATMADSLGSGPQPNPDCI